MHLAALLAVLFVAFVGVACSGPFLPLLVRHLGVTEPGAGARWAGGLMGLGPLRAVLTAPLWGQLPGFCAMKGGHHRRYSTCKANSCKAIDFIKGFAMLSIPFRRSAR